MGFIVQRKSSSQDGGIGRNPLHPHTTKRRITTNVKSINNQKCQKIKLHGTLTTTELKKQSTRTTRLVRLQMERTHSEAADLTGRAGCGEVAGCMGRAYLRETETQRTL